MPSGTYRIDTGDGRRQLERFRCAPGPAGWRYAATRQDEADGRVLGRIDLTVDARGGTVRLEVQGGGWQLRGGTVGGQTLWRRGDREYEQSAEGFTGLSPAYLVATARRLGPALAGGEPSRPVRLVEVCEEALATRLVRHLWSWCGAQDAGGVPVATYEVTDLDTGVRQAVLLAGDVVVSAAGITVSELDGAPTLARA